MFNYQEVNNRHLVNKYIRKIWTLNNFDNVFSSDKKSALPNGSLTIAIISGIGVLISTGQHTHLVKEGIYMFGQITKPLEIALEAHSKALMIQLFPWTPLMTTSYLMNDLVNDYIDLKYVNLELYIALSKALSFGEKTLINTIYQQFEHNIYFGPDVKLIKNITEQFVNRLTEKPLTIAETASNVNYSKRYIEQKFKLLAGLSPKEYYNIVQLRTLISELSEWNKNVSLTTLALKHGYYDQSHFVKMFSRVMGKSPSKFRDEHYIFPFS